MLFPISQSTILNQFRPLRIKQKNENNMNKVEEIFSSDKPFKEQIKELELFFDGLVSQLEERKRLLSIGMIQENYVPATVSIYDFRTEEDFEENPIP